jgi:hypothetical protein
MCRVVKNFSQRIGVRVFETVKKIITNIRPRGKVFLAPPEKDLKKEMTRRAKKTVITVETFQRTVARLRRKSKIIWCARCAAQVEMLAPNEAAAVLQITAREIFRLTETGEIHYSETDAGALFVCLDSCRFLQKRTK